MALKMRHHDSQLYRDHCFEGRTFMGPGQVQFHAGVSHIQASLSPSQKLTVIWVNPMGLGGPEKEMLSLSFKGFVDAIRGAQDLVDAKLEKLP